MAKADQEEYLATLEATFWRVWDGVQIKQTAQGQPHEMDHRPNP
jgi:hypothetical protein